MPITVLENHWNTLKICLFAHTTKQPLSKCEPWKSENYKKLWGLGPEILVAYKKHVFIIE